MANTMKYRRRVGIYDQIKVFKNERNAFYHTALHVPPKVICNYHLPVTIVRTLCS